jgi:hypothetical protein
LKIGIAMAVYRPEPEHFLEQLESIRNQSHSNWICVLSFDSAIREIRGDSKFLTFVQDERFIWSENSARLGVKKNFENAIRLAVARGCTSIACSDQDDIWYSHKLEVCAAELSRRAPLSLVHSDMHVLTAGKKLEKTAWQIERRGVEFSKPQHFLVRNTVAGAAMLFDAELARMYPVIPEGVPYHDHWFALVASFHGGVYPIHEPLYLYRQHGANVLGVTKYESLFSTGTVGRGGVLEKCRRVYRFSRDLAISAADAQMLSSSLWKTVFLKRRDPGLGFVALGLANIGRDQPLVRACLARAVGKFLTVFEKTDA